MDDCLINGNRVVIPEAMQPQILDILHLGHFGMQRMKYLARSAVYWRHIDSQIEDICRGCVPCTEHENKPPKLANHPWMMPEKPWSRIHLDHALNVMGNNWLVVTDAYSVPLYPPDKLNIHPGDNHVARERLRSFRIPSSNCVRQRNNVQFCRVPAIVPPERHRTPDWLPTIQPPVEPQIGWCNPSSSY